MNFNLAKDGGRREVGRYFGGLGLFGRERHERPHATCAAFKYAERRRRRRYSLRRRVVRKKNNSRVIDAIGAAAAAVVAVAVAASMIEWNNLKRAYHP